MKLIGARKCMLGFFFLASSLVTHPSSAVGLATGPSLGLAGCYSSFPSKQQGTKISINNGALQMGWFAKLDLWLLYAKLDTLFVLDWHRLPNKIDKHCFKHITIPVTIGIPFLNLLRPHIGLIFRIPCDDTPFKKNALVERYREKVNGYLFGIGLDLSNVLIDLDWEFGLSSVARKSIDSSIVDGDKNYRPKQFALRVGYNLFGLIG